MRDQSEKEEDENMDQILQINDTVFKKNNIIQGKRSTTTKEKEKTSCIE